MGWQDAPAIQSGQTSGPAWASAPAIDTQPATNTPPPPEKFGDRLNREVFGATGRDEDTLQVFNPFGKNLDTGIKIGADWSNALAGAGQGFTNLARRAGQAAGVVSESDIDESRIRDAELMGTKAGMAGNIAANVSMFAPTAFIPGANTVTGAALTGAATGLAQPTGTGDSTAKNVLAGAALGAGAQYGVQKVGGALKDRLSRITQSLTTRAAQNKGKDEIAKVAVELGYTIPPTSANPTAKNAVLESLGGKVLTEQKASLNNQQITNTLARKAIGLADDAPLSSETLAGLRQQAGQVYEQAKNLGTFTTDKKFMGDLSAISRETSKVSKEFPELLDKGIGELVNQFKRDTISAESVVELTKLLRERASAAYRAGNNEIGKANRSISNALEGLMERNIASSAAPQFLKTFRDARTTIAKAHTIEDAMDEAGNISSRKLASMLSRGDPLDGELKTAARFADTFPKASQDAKRSMLPGSPLDWAVAGGISYGAQDPRAMALLALRPGVRAAMLSKPYQRHMLSPDYSVGALSRIAPQVLENEAAQTGVRLLAPSVYAAQE